MQQEFQYSTKLRLFDDHCFSVNYVASAALLRKIFS